MTDIVSPQKRTEMMRGIRSGDTKPEIVVRKWLHAHGFRFRLHRKDLPGKPDIVLPKYQTVIFVHGCYWHRHSGCRLAYTPKSNQDFWNSKFEENLARDRRVQSSLVESGWNIIVVWECQVRHGTFAEELAKNGFGE